MANRHRFHANGFHVKLAIVLVAIVSSTHLVEASGRTLDASGSPAGSQAPACSLSAEQLKAQRAELLPGFFERAMGVTTIRNGLRLDFHHRPGLVTELAALIEREQVCCGFLRFRLITTEGGGPVSLEVRGPRGTAKLLKALQSS